MELQKKFRYAVSFALSNGTQLALNSPDEVTMPEERQETLKRFSNRLNREIKIPGRVSYSDLTLKGVLELKGDGSKAAIAEAVEQLQAMRDGDEDTVTITVTLLDTVGNVTYAVECIDCLVTSFKVDDLNRNQDDSHVHISMTASPAFVRNIEGSQIN